MRRTLQRREGDEKEKEWRTAIQKKKRGVRSSKTTRLRTLPRRESGTGKKDFVRRT